MLQFAVDYQTLKNEFKMRVVLEGKPIMIALLGDKVYAIQDKCPHMGASLSKGKIEDKEVTCRLHGATFDLETGEVKNKAHIAILKMPTKKAQTYPTVIKEDKVYVDL